MPLGTWSFRAAPRPPVRKHDHQVEENQHVYQTGEYREGQGREMREEMLRRRRGGRASSPLASRLRRRRASRSFSYLGPFGPFPSRLRARDGVLRVSWISAFGLAWGLAFFKCIFFLLLLFIPLFFGFFGRVRVLALA